MLHASDLLSSLDWGCIDFGQHACAGAAALYEESVCIKGRVCRFVIGSGATVFTGWGYIKQTAAACWEGFMHFIKTTHAAIARRGWGSPLNSRQSALIKTDDHNNHKSSSSWHIYSTGPVRHRLLLQSLFILMHWHLCIQSSGGSVRWHQGNNGSAYSPPSPGLFLRVTAIYVPLLPHHNGECCWR